MSEYAQKTGKGPGRARAARDWTRPTSRLTPSSVGGRPGLAAPDPFHAAMNLTPPVQAVAQLKRTLNQGAGVTQVAQRSRALQEKSGEIAQGRFDTIQRAEEEELLQGKFETAQRVEEEELVQGRFETAQRHATGSPFEAAPNQTGMPDHLKAGVESLSGLDLSDVRVHANSDSPAQLDALAYAQGTDIHLAPGQEHHLPHEAWHVVQQRQGRVVPTMQMQGVNINDDRSLEAEADTMGARALQVKKEATIPST